MIFGKKGNNSNDSPKNNPELQKLRNQFQDLKGNEQNPSNQSSPDQQNQPQNQQQTQQAQQQPQPGQETQQQGQQQPMQQQNQQNLQNDANMQQDLKNANADINQLKKETNVPGSGKGKGKKVPVDDYIDPVKLEENERVTNLIMQQIKELIEIDNNLNNKIKDIENKLNENTDTMNSTKDTVDGYSDRLNMIEKNMEKFMGLYEVITNKFNPFVTEEEGDSIFNAAESERGIKDENSKDKPEPEPNPEEIKIEEKKLEEEGAKASKEELSTEDIGADIKDEKMHDIISKIAPKIGEQLKTSVLANLNQQLNDIIARNMKESTQKLREEMMTMINEKTGGSAKSNALEQEVHPNYHFNLPDGTPIKSISHLISGLKNMNDATFSKYVNDSKNDFAQWVRVSTKNNDLADKMAKANGRGELIQVLEDI
jgi:archaellum component FlaC